MLKEYAVSETTESPLHQLGQIFLYVGILELYKYAGTEDIQSIGLIDREKWELLAQENKAELPPHLANTMIKYAKNNKLSKKISKKWSTAQRTIDQNIMQMARYITEGIIDAID